MDFPYEGQLYQAADKKAAGTVFFVHFYDGNKQLLRRHVELINSLGYDAFAFNLYTPPIYQPPFAKDDRFGVKHLYADQIGELLDLIPGRKVIYAFSNPGAGAIEAIVRRHFRDVTALVVDSGPTAKFMKSVFNLYGTKERMLPIPLRVAMMPIFTTFWSPRRHHDLPGQLAKFPAGFPVLSIRGGKDRLIPPQDIARVFEGHSQLELRVLDLPEAGHLTGLRDFPDDYVPVVRLFLNQVFR